MNQGFTRNHEDVEPSRQLSFYRSGKPVFSRARFRPRARLVLIGNRLHRMCRRPALRCSGQGHRQGQGIIENNLRLEECPVQDGFPLRGTRLTRIETFTDGAGPASNLGGQTGLGLYDTGLRHAHLRRKSEATTPQPINGPKTARQAAKPRDINRAGSY